MSNRPTICGVEGERAVVNELAAPTSGELASLGSLQWRRLVSSSCGEGPVDLLLRRLASLHAHLAGARPGLFLHVGRIYNERGYVEHATPEAADPITATTCVLAGERLLYEALSAREGVAGAQPLPITGIFNINLDYAETECSTCGCHENYSHCRPRPVLRAGLNPHLCSRVIFTGPGGFDPDRPLAYVLSPRAMLMPDPAGRREDDGLFHPRTEGYASAEWHRLHIYCGEFNRSPLAWYAKLASTALVVNLIDNGHEAEAGFAPCRPLHAFGVFSRDTTLTARVACVDRVQRTAMELQWALLHWAERGCAGGLGPPWAPQALHTWRNLLERLTDRGRAGVARALDWAIKWGVYDACCRDHDLTFERLLAWNEPLERLFERSPDHQQAVLQYASRIPTVPPHVRRSIPPPPEMGREIPWEELPRVLHLRRRLRELEWRYGQLGNGLFDKIRAAGVLDVEVPGITDDAVRHAMTHSPTDTRAYTRGQAIEQSRALPAELRPRADWNCLHDIARESFVRMDSLLPCPLRYRRVVVQRADSSALFERAIGFYRASRFTEALSILNRIHSIHGPDPEHVQREGSFAFRLIRYTAWVKARLGRNGIGRLERIHGTAIDASSFLKVADYLYCARLTALAPDPVINDWMDAASELMSAPPPSDEPLQAAVREHVGGWHLFHGRLDAADDAIGPAHRENCRWRKARIRCLLSDIERRRGRRGRAREFVESADPGIGHNVLRAEQIIPMQAKLTRSVFERGAMLDDAANVLRLWNHPVALARVLALRARGCRERGQTDPLLGEIQRLQQRAPSLADCRLTRRLIAEWEHWCIGGPSSQVLSGETDDEFWGL